MKLQVGYGTQTFRHSLYGPIRCYHKDAKKIKQKITFRHLLGRNCTTNVDNREIYTIMEKDHTYTYWLVEHKILMNEGKLEYIPIEQVYLVKESISNPGYWFVKLSTYKTLWSYKQHAEKLKRLELEKKNKKSWIKKIFKWLYCHLWRRHPS